MTSYLHYKKQLRIVQDADDIESWITVRGNHIPIKKGQSKEEAVKSFLEHQAGKNDLPQDTKWSPTNTKGEGTGNKSSQKKEKYNIQHGAKISDIENMINAHADKKAYKSWKEEEEYVAEKLKEEGIYAYGNQIKEAMKNVYGDTYTKEEAIKSSVEKKGESSSKSTKSSTGRFEVVGGNGVSHKKFETQEEAEKWAKENVNKLHTSLKVVGGYKKYKEYEPKKFAKAEPKEEKPEQKHVTIHTNKTFSDTMKRFGERYEDLYKNEDKYTGKHYSDLVTKFDEQLKSNPVFKKQVQEFVKERGDVLSSDREVKAYMLATANTVTGVKESDNSLEFVRTDYSNNPYEIKADKDSITINGKKFNVKYNSEYHWKAKKGGNTIETSAENAIGLAKRLKNIDDANVGNLFLKALMGIQ